MTRLTRRRILRGVLDGAAVAIALPLLDCFLDGHGEALASGAPMPKRFGTWFWGCGMDQKVFTPKTFGANYDLPPELAALAPVRQHVNLYSNFNVLRDTAPLICHTTGWVVLMSGVAPMTREERPGESLDFTIAKQIGKSTRFQTLSATATGDVRNTFSYENVNSPNAAEPSPVNFYTRLFGADFQDPNAPDFKPNPRVMARKSVLSGVMEQTRDLQAGLGAEDRARLDQYFTGLRSLEHQFDQQLTKPEPIGTCHPMTAPKEDPAAGSDATLTALRHKLMTDLMVMAVACDQTRVFNMSYSAAQATTTKPGYEKPHHTTTHEERVDDALGYQPTVSWFTQRSMESFAYFVQAFAAIQEGRGTLLDNTLIYGITDHSLARIHALEGVPMFTAGRAGGLLKTGVHVDGAGSPGTRLGFTALRAMGVETASWGDKSNKTSKEIGEVLA